VCCSGLAASRHQKQPCPGEPSRFVTYAAEGAAEPADCRAVPPTRTHFQSPLESASRSCPAPVARRWWLSAQASARASESVVPPRSNQPCKRLRAVPSQCLRYAWGTALQSASGRSSQPSQASGKPPARGTPLRPPTATPSDKPPALQLRIGQSASSCFKSSIDQPGIRRLHFQSPSSLALAPRPIVLPKAKAAPRPQAHARRGPESSFPSYLGCLTRLRLRPELRQQERPRRPLPRLPRPPPSP